MAFEIHGRVPALVVVLAVVAGCNFGSSSAVGPLWETARLDTAAVLARPGATGGVGQSAIDAAFVDAGRFVVLVYGGGSRYVVASDTEALAKVCVTATSIVAGARGVAVGCGPSGDDPPRVHILDPTLASSRTVDLLGADMVAFSPTVMNWPIVDPELERAALPVSGDRIALYRLRDGVRQVTLSLATTRSPVVDMFFSDSGDRLAVAREDGRVELFDLRTPTASPTLLAPPDEDHSPAVAFSPSGDRVAVASFWGQFRLFSTDGSLLASSASPGDRYGPHDVAYAGADRILQARAGALVIRDGTGEQITVVESDAGDRRPFGPPPFGGIGRVAARGDTVLTVTTDGTTTVLARFGAPR